MKCIIDSNSFIASSRTFYSFGHFPTFWKWFFRGFNKGNFILPKCVFNEITKRGKGTDLLTKKIIYYLHDNIVKDFSSDEKYVTAYANIINYIQDCGYYKQEAVSNWAQSWKADPKLIAIAKSQSNSTDHYSIVTFEKRVGSELTTKNPQKKEPKIPDVAYHFNIECITLYELENRFKLRI